MDPKDAYLDLMRKSLTFALWDETRLWKRTRISTLPFYGAWVARGLAKTGRTIMEPMTFSAEKREFGRDWPTLAHTMIGTHRLKNLQECCETVLREGVPGDFIETGVWRGGACIFMRAILRAYNDRQRTVWLADSFEGLPPPNVEDYPTDREVRWHEYKELRVSLEEVKDNFRRYGLLDDQVRFLKGWFKDTLPVAPIEKLAVLRLDGDMYESTIQALDALYPKLQPGGFLIVDDYVIPECRKAIEDYRERHGIREEACDIDGTGAYWRKLEAPKALGKAGSLQSS